MFAGRCLGADGLGQGAPVTERVNQVAQVLGQFDSQELGNPDEVVALEGELAHAFAEAIEENVLDDLSVAV